MKTILNIFTILFLLVVGCTQNPQSTNATQTHTDDAVHVHDDCTDHSHNHDDDHIHTPKPDGQESFILHEDDTTQLEHGAHDQDHDHDHDHDHEHDN